MTKTTKSLYRGIVCLALALTAMHSAAGSDPTRAARDLRAKFTTDIEDLARWCESKGLAEEAKKTRRVLSPTEPNKLFVSILNNVVGPAKLPADASKEAVEWDQRLAKLRRDYASSLFDMARRSVRSRREGLAFELAIEAVHADPDYEPVRRLFGFQKFRDHWRTAYEVKKLRTGSVWNDKFGWLPKNYVRRYEDGQRLVDGRWIPAVEDAKRHQDIRNGWEVETEHYTIRTNHSIEAGVQLGLKLERLYRLWQQLFVRYFASEADVVGLFDGRARPTPYRQHQIVYFRDRADYKRFMQDLMPNIDTIGLYRDRPPCAYFFAGDEADDRTLFHEATHQLFHESRPVAPSVGQNANFWIVEGIAMYMESLRREDGFYVLGGFEDARMHAARYRFLESKFYVPLKEFAGYGRERFQKDPRIATLYSQAAGLANFLVHYDGGRYRDALVAYLVMVYTGRDGPDTLTDLTGTDFSTLDKQYREFVTGPGQEATKKAAAEP